MSTAAGYQRTRIREMAVHKKVVVNVKRNQLTHIERWPTAAVRDRLSWLYSLRRLCLALFSYAECGNVRQGKALKNINKFCVCFFN